MTRASMSRGWMVALLLGASIEAQAQESADAAAPPTAAPEVLVPTAQLGFEDMLRLVQRRSATLPSEQLAIESAAADVQQSRLLPNPVVDAGWGTIPLGPTNPPGLRDPLLQIPNYSLGASYTFLVGKRGPRTQRARALVDSARAGYQASARDQALTLARVVGRLAAARLRLEGLRGLVRSGKGTADVARIRMEAGQGTPLELDRIEIELGRQEQQMRAAESDERTTQTECARLIGAVCGAFADGDQARAFLASWIERAARQEGDPEQRPAVQALDAQRRAAEAEGELARAQAVPDPTVRLGYVYDQFVISGNQRHSLNLSLSLPLPLFDRGQAQMTGAQARARRTAEVRARVVAADRARLVPLREALTQQRQRHEAVTTQLLPRARTAMADMDRAVSSRLLPLTDVIPLRRTVDELLIEEADSLADAFATSVELLSLLPSAPESR